MLLRVEKIVKMECCYVINPLLPMLVLNRSDSAPSLLTESIFHPQMYLLHLHCSNAIYGGVHYLPIHTRSSRRSSRYPLRPLLGKYLRPLSSWHTTPGVWVAFLKSQLRMHYRPCHLYSMTIKISQPFGTFSVPLMPYEMQIKVLRHQPLCSRNLPELCDNLDSGFHTSYVESPMTPMLLVGLSLLRHIIIDTWDTHNNGLWAKAGIHVIQRLEWVRLPLWLPKATSDHALTAHGLASKTTISQRRLQSIARITVSRKHLSVVRELLHSNAAYPETWQSLESAVEATCGRVDGLGIRLEFDCPTFEVVSGR